MCSLIPLPWLGTVPPYILWNSLLRYAGARWPATPNARMYRPPPTPLPFRSWTLHRAPALAFSSQDKGPWCLACRDLIAKSHFTFPKPGLIHLSAPADRNMLLSPLFRCLCFSFPPNLKKRKNGGIRSRLDKRKKKCPLPPFYLHLWNFSFFHRADCLFPFVLHKLHSHAFPRTFSWLPAVSLFWGTFVLIIKHIAFHHWLRKKQTKQG